MSDEGFWSLRNAPTWWFDRRAWAVLAAFAILLLASRWYYGPSRVPEGQIVVYGASWCEYCAALRRHLDDSRIPYVERDVDASTENFLRYMWAAGKSSVLPVVQVGPRVVSKGYRRAEIDAALGAAGYRPDARPTGPEGGSPRR
jgi:glutaredoxin